MIRVLSLIVVLSLAACGGDEPTPAQSAKPKARTSTNSAPVIDSVRFVPEAPGVGDVLSVAIRAIDPDGDRLDIEVDWYRNGAVEQSGPETRLETDDFRQGDEVWAEVWVSDGEEEVTFTTETLAFENQAPDVLAVRIVPGRPSGADTLMLEANTFDREDDVFELVYRWYVNGELVSDAKGAALEPGHVKRGDEVEAEIAAVDGSGRQGDWIRSPAVEIRNSPPVVSSRASEATVGEGLYRYQIKAEDPDGDRPLRYSLVEGPAGLRVDLISGLVSWQVPDGKGGDFPIRVRVSDPLGAATEHDYTLTLAWQDEPASPQRRDDLDEEGENDDFEDDSEDEDDAEDAYDSPEDDEESAEE